MGGKIYTYEQMILEQGEIPYCQCKDFQGNSCGLKVNVKPNKFGSFRYYKKHGYPRFIYGHNNKGMNSPSLGKIFSQDEKDKLSESLKEYYRTHPEANLKNSEARKEYFHLHPDAMKGENNGMFGKDPWNKGLTKETNLILKKQSENLKGKPLLQTTCDKLSESHKGKPTWNKGLVDVMPEAWNKLEFPPIFDLCWCLDHCNIIVWGGRRYVNGHQYRRKYRKTGGKSHPMYGKSPHHDQKIYPHFNLLQGFLKMFRWDRREAMYLDSINEPYLYEPKAFELILNNKEVTYTPDFYLPDQDLFIEVKGYWRKDAKEKYDLFLKTYPEIKIKLIYARDLEKLGIDLEFTKEEREILDKFKLNKKNKNSKRRHKNGN